MIGMGFSRFSGRSGRMGVALVMFPAWPRSHFPWRENTPHDGSVHLVFAFAHVAGIVFHSQYKDRQGAFLVEVLFSDGHRQHSVQTMLPVGGLVPVFSHIPGEDAGLIVV